MLKIAKRNELHNLIVLPRRWIIERTLAWISRNRRLARNFLLSATPAPSLHSSGWPDPHHAATPDPHNSLNVSRNFPDRI